MREYEILLCDALFEKIIEILLSYIKNKNKLKKSMSKVLAGEMGISIQEIALLSILISAEFS